jgi:hypothetical protein
MMSTMMPTLVFKDDKPWLVVGTPGGGRIINTVLQIVVNVVDFRLNIDEATHQPRISQGDGPLEVEPNFNPDTLALLRKKGHEIRPERHHGQRAIDRDRERDYFFGAADPRRPGAAADRALRRPAAYRNRSTSARLGTEGCAPTTGDRQSRPPRHARLTASRSAWPCGQRGRQRPAEDIARRGRIERLDR